MTVSHPPRPLDDQPMSVRAKLAAAWAAFMCLYIYVDVLGFYAPGAVSGILKGQVHTFDITEGFFVAALAAAAVPIMMLVLSAALPARAARRTNLGVATLLTPWMAFNVTGGQWPFYYGLGFALELIVLAFILRSAWTWPLTVSPAVSRRQPASSPIGMP